MIRLRSFLSPSRFIAICLLAFCGAAASAWAAPAAGGQAPGAAAPRWEYCEIEYIRGTSPWFPASAGSDGGDRLQWSSATVSVDARSWRELAGKMKVALPDRMASSKVAFLDALGSMGWELVSATVPSGQAAPASTWTFKRRVP